MKSINQNNFWALVVVLGISMLGGSLAHAASILVDGKGQTVYTFDIDHGTTSNCYDKCETNWPPVRDLGNKVDGLGTTVRKDGTHQVTFDGKPIYYYAGDLNPGDSNGDGLGGVWHVISE